MSRKKFDLLDKKYPEDKAGKHSDNAEVKQLRDQARNLRDENNKVIRQLWDIDFKLNASPTASERTHLLKSQKELTETLEREKYLEKLKELLDQIKQMEMDLFGHSDINSNSPYEL